MVDEPTYSYRELAQRIEEVFGVRPSQSALRAAAAASRRSTTTHGWPRMTAGMPAPEATKAKTSPASFSVRKVEAWLRRHPRLAADRAYAALAASAGNPRARLDLAVSKARRAGLSWRLVAAAITEGTGVPHSPAGVHKAFRDHDSKVG